MDSFKFKWITRKKEYTYSALPSGNFIRCFALAPGRNNEKLRGGFRIVDIDKDAEFEAISYVWGSPKRDCLVVADEALLPITTNLQQALQRLRYPSKERVLWADGICINQADLKERGRQVALMSSIYSNATRTLICLGVDKNGDGPVGAALFSEVASTIKQKMGNNASLPKDLPWLEASHSIWNDKRWTSCKALLDCPWFERGWVVQEAALSRNATIIWGRGELDWLSFALVMFWIKHIGPIHFAKYGLNLSSLHSDMCIHGRLSSVFSLDDSPGGWRSSLPQIMRVARSLELSDPRDRVFAFLGFAARYDREWLPGDFSPDYERSYVDIYHDFASQYMLSTGSSKELLDAVQHDSSSLASHCPSWVPRWDLDLHKRGLRPTHSEFLTPAEDSTFKMVRLPVHHVDGRVYMTNLVMDTVRSQLPLNGKLRMRGVIIDKIGLVTPCYIHDGGRPSTIALAAVWNAIVDREKATGIEAYDRSSRFLAFCHSLTAGDCNWDHSYSHSREQEAAAFEQYLTARGARNQEGTPGARAGDTIFFTAVVYGHGRRVLMLERGYYALGPATIRAGDLCCILFTTLTPFIIRPTDESGQYKLIGPVFVTAPTSRSRANAEYPEFGLLGYKESKLWPEWGLKEEDIILL